MNLMTYVLLRAVGYLTLIDESDEVLMWVVEILSVVLQMLWSLYEASDKNILWPVEILPSLQLMLMTVKLFLMLQSL